MRILENRSKIYSLIACSKLPNDITREILHCANIYNSTIFPLYKKDVHNELRRLDVKNSVSCVTMYKSSLQPMPIVLFQDEFDTLKKYDENIKSPKDVNVLITIIRKNKVTRRCMSICKETSHRLKQK